MRTSDDFGPLIAPVVLGIVIFPHGAQKLLGWFGGPGFDGTMQLFTGTMGIPWIFAFLAIIAEFFGALGLISGLLGRVAAFGIACAMVVAVFMGISRRLLDKLVRHPTGGGLRVPPARPRAGGSGNAQGERNLVRRPGADGGGAGVTRSGYRAGWRPGCPSSGNRLY
jgi:uncharacterized membrane protein YphA (DoxX/SURF4 family)